MVTPCVGVWIEILMDMVTMGLSMVTPCVGVWIEMILEPEYLRCDIVTPCVGVWIEIIEYLMTGNEPVSLPAWECGLKSSTYDFVTPPVPVTPCVGVWIEIAETFAACAETLVTPCVGVWIEINVPEVFSSSSSCHSLRGSVD